MCCPGWENNITATALDSVSDSRGNQTGILAGVTDKKSYYQIRIIGSLQRMKWLNDHISGTDEITAKKTSRWTEVGKSKKAALESSGWDVYHLEIIPIRTIDNIV